MFIKVLHLRDRAEIIKEIEQSIVNKQSVVYHSCNLCDAMQIM